jgi:gliding motility-associated-like protein
LKLLSFLFIFGFSQFSCVRKNIKLPAFLRILSCVILSVWINNLHGQRVNECNVKASFTPDNDTAFTGSYLGELINTSTDATSIAWYVDGFPAFNSSNTFRPSISEVGIHEIMLVARNGNCTDTTISYFTNYGSPIDKRLIRANYGMPATQDVPKAIDSTADGGFLLGGNSYDRKTQFTRPYVIKISEVGCVEWSKLLEVHGYLGALRTLSDGGFFALINVSPYHNVIMARFDKNGGLIWKREFDLRTYLTALDVIYEVGDGSLIIAGGHSTFNGFVILRIDLSGQALWSKYYRKYNGDFATPKSVTRIHQTLFISGFVNDPNNDGFNSEYNKDGFLMSMELSSGQTNWTKIYGSNTGTDFFYDIHNIDGKLIVNGTSTAYLGVTKLKSTIQFFSPTGAILKSSTLNNTSFDFVNPFNSKIIPSGGDKLYLFQAGTTLITLQPYQLYPTTIIRMDTSGSVLWSKNSTDRTTRYEYATMGKDKSIAILGGSSSKLLKPWEYFEVFSFARFDSTGSQGVPTCGFNDINIHVEPYPLIAKDFTWTEDRYFNYSTSDKATGIDTAYTHMRYTCPDKIDSCSLLKVRGPSTICNLSKTYTYRIHRNNNCGYPIKWTFPNNTEIIEQDDTKAVVRFKTFGNHRVFVSIAYSCNPLVDSMFTRASPSTIRPFNIGADTSICPMTSLTLKAGRGYKSYAWQDGSTDSNFLVTAPGLYWVQVLDSCDNLFRDSVNITLTSNLSVNAGPDRFKCNNDTLRLTAPSGYQSYNWQPNYNISSTNTQAVVVNPLIDTAYILKAEKAPGCFAYDTIQVKVKRSPVIFLGDDAQFCDGKYLTLDAGPAFQSYLWSIGATSQKITVKTTGSYRVIAVTSEGCKSYDTLNVLNVFPLPQVKLDRNPELCIGSSRTFDAGLFSQYLWQDGSQNRNFNIKDTGTYHVKVLDANQCEGSDTVHITTLLPRPANFLPNDTTICSYSSLGLKSIRNYSAYNWSINDPRQSITINKGGTYWLEVTDEKGCKGKDSIVIQTKQCLKGLFVPSGFTPNRDGKNDQFKAQLFGPINVFELTVYNRWGEVVFRSSDPDKGWDGKYKGKEQDGGAFVWICRYQLEREEAKVERGTVTLIR